MKRSLLTHFEDTGIMFRLTPYIYVCCKCGFTVPTQNPAFVPEDEQKEIDQGFTNWRQARDYNRRQVALAGGKGVKDYGRLF